MITSNSGKFSEIKSVIPFLERLDIDLQEIQDIIPENVVRSKLIEGVKNQKCNLMVEDTSLHLSCMNGFPGPLVKWLLKSVGAEGIYNMVVSFNNTDAEARCTIGYASQNGDFHFFEGSIKGKIVSPRGNIKTSFGWDSIFMPDGKNKTFAEMSESEKTSISHRGIAARKLAEFLSTQTDF